MKMTFYCKSDVLVMDLKTINMHKCATPGFQLAFFG